jgi:hypothetical protein
MGGFKYFFNALETIFRNYIISLFRTFRVKKYSIPIAY